MAKIWNNNNFHNPQNITIILSDSADQLLKKSTRFYKISSVYEINRHVFNSRAWSNEYAFTKTCKIMFSVKIDIGTLQTISQSSPMSTLYRHGIKKHRDFSRYQVPVTYAIPPVLMQTGVLLCWLTHQGQEMHRVSELGHHWFKQLLVPIRRQIIAWTSDNLLSTVPVGTTSTKFQSNYKNNCTRKLISKWRLRNGCHLSTLKCV